MKSLAAVLPLYLMFIVSHCKGSLDDWYRTTNPVAAENPTTGYKFDIYPKPGEAEALYYKRIIAQYGYEKENEYRIRMEIYKFLLPGLPIWNNDEYLKYKSFDFTASEPEITEEARENILLPQKKYWESERLYYLRLFRKGTDEQINQYIRKVCILNTKLASAGAWPVSYMTYVQPHLTPYVKKPETSSQVTPTSTSSPSSGVPRYSIEVNRPVPLTENKPVSTQQSGSTTSEVIQSPNNQPISHSIDTPPNTQFSSPSIFKTFDKKGKGKKDKGKKGKGKKGKGKKGKGKKGKDTEESCEEGDEQSEENVDIYPLEGESDEAFCKRLFQTEAPIDKTEYKRRLKILRKQYKTSKILKQAKKGCKQFLVQTDCRTGIVGQVPGSQQAPLAPTAGEVPDSQQAPTLKPTSYANRYVDQQGPYA